MRQDDDRFFEFMVILYVLLLVAGSIFFTLKLDDIVSWLPSLFQ